MTLLRLNEIMSDPVQKLNCTVYEADGLSFPHMEKKIIIFHGPGLGLDMNVDIFITIFFSKLDSHHRWSYRVSSSLSRKDKLQCF